MLPAHRSQEMGQRGPEARRLCARHNGPSPPARGDDEDPL